MKIAVVLTGGTLKRDIVFQTLKRCTGASIIGIDGGCAMAESLGLELDLMIGDFDSLDSDTFIRMQEKAKECIRLNPMKDLTDTHAAFEYLSDKGYDKAIILGAFGTRIDHTMANMYVAMKYAQKIDIEFIDEHNKIFLVSGTCEIIGNHGLMVENEMVQKQGVVTQLFGKNQNYYLGDGYIYIGDITEYSYISIVPLEKTYIQSTVGLKYPLIKYELDPYDSFSISNEANGEISIKVGYGKALIIVSKD